MRTFLECIPCFATQTLAAVRRATDDAAVHEKVLKDVLRLTADMDSSTIPAAMAQKIYRLINEATGRTNHRAEEKRQLNECALALVDQIRAMCTARDDEQFERLVRMSIAGNIMDLGVHASIDTEAVVQTMQRALTVDIDTGAVHEFERLIREAGSILYIGDNAGEIVFDRVFIEHMPRDRIVFAVRGAPVINDVTMEDARAVGMDRLVRVIDNGSDAPGTILDDCSDAFRAEFEAAGLIIAKGQGNYETLSDADKTIVFLLQAKCPVIARDVGCATGAFVVGIAHGHNKSSSPTRATEDSNP